MEDGAYYVPPQSQSQPQKRRAKKTLETVSEKPIKKLQNPKEKAQSNKKKKPVRIIFLGGVGEIGKNMTAIEYGNDIIVVDAGLTFPSVEDMPGIDSVVPDVTYLAQNKHKVRGVLLTHGHEDHIGGVPYLMKELAPNTPIFGTKLTLMLTDNKLQEHRIQNVTQKVVEAGDRVKLGAFEVEFINVNHSISGACALAIRTPVGLIYHSSDFKIDLTPVAGAPIDLKRIAELGKEGVLLYMGESTNIERAGYTMSETVVGTTLDHLFSENMNRRLIIATFASNVHRLQQIIDLAVKYRRKVALSGRSMFKVVDAAVKIGELIIPEGILIDIERTKNLFDGELLILSTGSQGEPMSALTRMASGDFNKVTIGVNDTIIISANPIPGNEKMIYRVINNLYKIGARVVYESLEKIHVSGHACQEEHKILYSLLRPKFFIPVHGEYRHLKRHAQLVESLGLPERNVLITEIGNCVELTDREIKIADNVPAGTLLIDGEGSEDYGTSEVMKDRLKMSADGIFSVALAVTGNYVINDPVIESHGFMFTETTGSESELKSIVQRAVENYDYANGNKDELVAHVRKSLKNYFYKTTKQSPLIIVSVLDV
ncbi:MAG: ribonuclease J [Clostridia bacterium]|nr:ribonuclease J [Clostridia bacterium]